MDQSHYIYDALDLSRRGLVNDAIDTIMQAMDVLLETGRWGQIDYDLSTLSVGDWPTSILRIWLSQTNCVKDKLPSRAALYEACVVEFDRLGRNTTRLLGRLK